MKIYKEISLADFEAWSGAVDTMETLQKLEDETGENVFDTLEDCLEDCIDDMGEGVDETTINDILWFETDTIAVWLGYEDWEALDRAAEGIEEEEEEEEIELTYSVGDHVGIGGEEWEIIDTDNTDADACYFCAPVVDGETEEVKREWFCEEDIDGLF